MLDPNAREAGGEWEFDVMLSFVGDISFARDVAEQVRDVWHGNYSRTLEGVREHIASDLAIANLESVFVNPEDKGTALKKRIVLAADGQVGASGEPLASASTKPLLTRVPPRQAVSALQYAGIDVVCLSNNHILDVGTAALR